jgi:hypothetical protein
VHFQDPVAVTGHAVHLEFCLEVGENRPRSLADAGHMFTDSAGLLIALIAAWLALKPATQTDLGYNRAEITAAAGQAALPLGVAAFLPAGSRPTLSRQGQSVPGRLRRERTTRSVMAVRAVAAITAKHAVPATNSAGANPGAGADESAATMMDPQ